MSEAEQIGVNYIVEESTGKLKFIFSKDVDWITFTKLEARRWKEILENYLSEEELVIPLPTDPTAPTSIGLNILVENDKLKFQFASQVGWIAMDKTTTKIILQNIDIFLNSNIRHLQSVK